MSFENTSEYAAIEDSIKLSGGDEHDIAVWREVWDTLSQFCYVEEGSADDYTKDIVLCWCGWVMNSENDVARRILTSIEGFNLTFRDDEVGIRGEKIMKRAIEVGAQDPIKMFQVIAIHQLHRICPETEWFDIDYDD